MKTEMQNRLQMQKRKEWWTLQKDGMCECLKMGKNGSSGILCLVCWHQELSLLYPMDILIAHHAIPGSQLRVDQRWLRLGEPWQRWQRRGQHGVGDTWIIAVSTDRRGLSKKTRARTCSSQYQFHRGKHLSSFKTYFSPQYCTYLHWKKKGGFNFKMREIFHHKVLQMSKYQCRNKITWKATRCPQLLKTK